MGTGDIQTLRAAAMGSTHTVAPGGRAVLLQKFIVENLNMAVVDQGGDKVRRTPATDWKVWPISSLTSSLKTQHSELLLGAGSASVVGER